MNVCVGALKIMFIDCFFEIDLKIVEIEIVLKVDMVDRQWFASRSS